MKRMRRDINPASLNDQNRDHLNSVNDTDNNVNGTDNNMNSTDDNVNSTDNNINSIDNNLNSTDINVNGTDDNVNGTDNITSSVPLQSSAPTMLTLWTNKDVNITLYCQSYWLSCRGRCTQERKLGGTEQRLQCFCDRSCEFFRDCCADFDQFCSSSGISPQGTANPDGSGLWECVSSYNSFTKVAGVWMISSCPRNVTQVDIKENCSKDLLPSFDNFKDNVPVIDRTGKTYKNRYCAQCHGFNLTELKFYNFQLDCDVPVPKEYKRKEILSFLSTFCDRPFWKPPEGATRRYCHSLEPNNYCSDISLPSKVQQKCLNGSLRLVYQTAGFELKTFFNPYCALCSFVKNFTCGPGPYPSSTDGNLAKPFSLVLNLDFSKEEHRGSETSEVRGLKVTCLEQGYVYDFYLEACRPGIKPSDATAARQKIFIVSVWMRSGIPSSWLPLITEVNFQEAIANELNINKTLISNISIGNPFGPVSTVVFNINMNPTIQKNFSTQSLQTTMNSLSITLNCANFTFFKVTVKLFHCAKIEIFNADEYHFQRNAVKINNTGEIYQEVDYYTNETEWKNGSLVPVGVLTVCKQPRLNCSGVLIRLTEDEYVFLTNGSLYRNVSRELLEQESFLWINDTIWVCTQFSSHNKSSMSVGPPRKTDSNTVLVVLTYGGLSLSIISFVLVLLTYSLFKELRTVPGINLMNLSLSQLLVDLVFLATGYVEAKFACIIIAILLHYFFLVSFTWMSVISFETWNIFSKTRIQHRKPSRKKKRCKLLQRAMIGWLPAFVFVVTCVALDQTNAVAFHYGGIKGCWINNSSANLFFFVLPVAFSISFNAVCFSLTVRAIWKTNKQAQRATHEAVKRKTAVVFLKIFILMGFTWIFGFLQVLVSDFFEYPFIIFATLQGLYVALAFVFTSRVKQMYHTLLCNIKTNSARESRDTRL